MPYRWFDVELDEEGRRLAELAGASADDLPLVLLPDGEPLRAPTNVQIADALGLSTQAQQPLYDVCIVGGGPAGLAAAVYAASEGLSTIVVEREAPGGQAGTSAVDRELPRLPERPQRRRPDPAGDGAGRSGSAPRWCWRATWSALEQPGARSGPCCSRAAP